MLHKPLYEYNVVGFLHLLLIPYLLLSHRVLEPELSHLLVHPTQPQVTTGTTCPVRSGSPYWK